MDEKWTLSRRALLGGLGATAAATWLGRRDAIAQSITVPKRFVVVHVPEGMWSGAARPSGDPNSSLGPIFEPLDPYRDRLSVLDDISMRSREHGPGGDGHHRGVPHMLTCTEMADEANAGGPSVDQKIAAAIGQGTRFQSLQFGVRIIYGDTNARLIWAGARDPRPPMESPWEAYSRLFADASSPPEVTFDLRRSALDNAMVEIQSLRGRLSTPDRDRLDSYHQSLREIETRLAATPPLEACGPLPDIGPDVGDVKAEHLYPDIGRLQMDLIVAALRCDLTRVASLQWGNSNDQCSYPWLGVHQLGHDLAHGGPADKKQTVFRWYAEQFAYLLGQFDAVPEGSGTMLDNTVVLWVSEFGESNEHSPHDLLWLLMGNAGGYLRQGQRLSLGGRSVSDVHATIAGAFGITDATFGNPAYSEGLIDQLRA